MINNTEIFFDEHSGGDTSSLDKLYLVAGRLDFEVKVVADGAVVVLGAVAAYAQAGVRQMALVVAVERKEASVSAAHLSQAERGTVAELRTMLLLLLLQPAVLVQLLHARRYPTALLLLLARLSVQLLLTVALELGTHERTVADRLLLATQVVAVSQCRTVAGRMNGGVGQQVGLGGAELIADLVVVVVVVQVDVGVDHL